MKKKPKRISVPASVAHLFAIIERKELANEGSRRTRPGTAAEGREMIEQNEKWRRYLGKGYQAASDPSKVQLETVANRFFDELLRIHAKLDRIEQVLAMKKTGIPIGKYDAIAEVAGKTKIKPKKKHKTLQQQYASKHGKRWKAAK